MIAAPERWILSYHPPDRATAGYAPECKTPGCSRRACTGSERDFAEYCCRACATAAAIDQPTQLRHGEACERHHPGMAALIVPVDARKTDGAVKRLCVHALQALVAYPETGRFRACPSCFDVFCSRAEIEALIPAQCPECSTELVTLGAAVGRLVMSW